MSWIIIARYPLTRAGAAAQQRKREEIRRGPGNARAIRAGDEWHVEVPHAEPACGRFVKKGPDQGPANDEGTER